MNSPFLNIDLEDLGKGLILAVLTSVLTIIYSTLQAGSLNIDWNLVGSTALTSALGYLLKNLFTNSNVAFATATIGGVTPVTVHDGGMTFNDGTSQYTAYPGFTVSIPSSSTSSGITGQLSFDSSYVYICVGPNQWKRIAASDF